MISNEKNHYFILQIVSKKSEVSKIRSEYADISKTGVESLSAALTYLCNINFLKLNLSENNLTKEGVESISGAL